MNEVIIVMAIIAIMATFAIPSFLHWLPNIRLKNAGRDLYSNMQRAKVNAIKQNKEWAIIFVDNNLDDENNSYSICDDSGDGNWTTAGDNNCIETVMLSDYKSGIKFGQGNSGAPIGTSYNGSAGNDHVSYTNELVTFNSRGTGKDGYVYLDNEDNTAIAIGTLTSGVIRYVQWRGSWQ